MSYYKTTCWSKAQLPIVEFVAKHFANRIHETVQDVGALSVQKFNEIVKTINSMGIELRAMDDRPKQGGSNGFFYYTNQALLEDIIHYYSLIPGCSPTTLRQLSDCV